MLRGADFSRARPKIIMVEAIKPLSLAPAWDEWEPMLAKAGYAYVWDDELNRYYVAEEARALAEKLTAGPKWYADGPQIGNYKPAAEDATHPDHRLARLLAGADMGKLPLAPRDELLALLTAGLAPQALAAPATASDIAAISERLFGRGRARATTAPAASIRDAYARRHRFGPIPHRLRAHLRELFLVFEPFFPALRHPDLPPTHGIRYTAMRAPRAESPRRSAAKLNRGRLAPARRHRDLVMRSASGGPRVLLRRLREVMAEPVSAQDRLNKIVVLIAANMVAEVCSLYVLRVDGTLELYATEGLNPKSVHVTVLRQDEGLVGLVASEAKSLNLSDAQHHPAFSFRPETGEEIYHSFLGVPILRAGNTLGVLVVQNRAQRTYSEDEEEALQTTAMVLAETIASGELSALAKPGLEPAAHRPLQLEGLVDLRRHRARPCGAARAARGRDPAHRRRSAEGIAAPRCRAQQAARRPRPAAGAPRRRRRRRAPRRARSLCDVRARPRLDAPDARGGDDRPHRRGRGRARAVRQPRPHDAPDRSLSARAAARSRRSRQPADAPAGRARPRAARASSFPTTRSWSRARWARPRCSTTTARSCAGWCWRKAGRPRTCRSWRARSASRRSARSPTPPASSIRATRSSSTARWATSMSARPPDVEKNYADRVRLRARRQAQYAELRDRADRDQGRREDRAAAQCRPAGRPAAHRRDRRQRHRPVPHRAAVHGRARAAAQRRAAPPLSPGARRRRKPAGDLPHARYRRRQGAALYALRGGRGEPGARMARDPLRPRPPGPVAHADPRAARCRGRTRAAHHVPDGHDGRRVRSGQGAGREGTYPFAPPRPHAARRASMSA